MSHNTTTQVAGPNAINLTDIEGRMDRLVNRAEDLADAMNAAVFRLQTTATTVTEGQAASGFERLRPAGRLNALADRLGDIENVFDRLEALRLELLAALG